MHAPQLSVSIRDGYRPDIDGLRAIAVLSVLAYHFGLPLPGGFTGVDVFFVISGYLITARLAADIRAGTFSILSFYDRRIRRIVPALLVMLGAALLAGWFLLLPGDYKSLAASAAYAALGASNFFFLNHTGYFDPIADIQPLLHTWSLAVEEQFYLVWPLLIFLIAKAVSQTRVAAIISALTVTGLVTSLAWSHIDPKSAFYLALPRTWELTLGALLVFVSRVQGLRGIPTLLGLALIGAGFLLIAANTPPGPAALLPCLGAALVIWPQHETSWAAKCLGRLAPIGLISYSLYLWHWPVLVYYRFFINGGHPTSAETATLMATSIALATASYFFVERPLRKPRLRPAYTVFAGVLASAVILCVGANIAIQDGLPSRSTSAHNMRSLDAMWEWNCPANKTFAMNPNILCVFGAPWSETNDKAVLWGDSNAEQFPPFLNQAAKAAGVSVILNIRCAAILDDKNVRRNDIDYNAFCGFTRSGTLKYLTERQDVKTVILAAAWGQLLQRLVGPASKDPAAIFEAGLRDTISTIVSSGKRVVLVATIPQWSHDPVPCALLETGLWRRRCNDNERFLPKELATRLQSISLEVMKRISAEFPQMKFIVPIDRLCQSSICITRVSGESIYRDPIHFRRNLDEATNREVYRLIGFDGIF